MRRGTEGDGGEGQRVQFAPMDAVLSEPLPFGTAWQVEGDSGIGKTVLAAHFAMQGLRRGETVIFVASDDAPERVRASLQRFGFAVGTYEHAGKLILVDAFSGTGPEAYRVADRGDGEEIVYLLSELAGNLPRPTRVVIDSVTSIAAYMEGRELVHFVYEKNRILKEPGIALLDLYLAGAMGPREMVSLSNAYDVAVRLAYGEDRGGIPRRCLQVRKVRGGSFDPRPFPFSVHRGHGIVVDGEHYSR